MLQFLTDNLLPFVLVLGFLVFVHELGHFLMAKALGIKVLRFSMGFPPRAFGIQIGETDYCISWLPLGGYVKMAGDEQDSSTGAAGEFLTAAWWRRALIAVAGPGSNIIWAYVIIWAALVTGVPEPDSPAVVYLRNASPLADSLGVVSGDRIASVGGTAVQSMSEFIDALDDTPGMPAWPREFVLRGDAGEKRLRLDEPTAVRLAMAIQPAHAPVIGNVLVNQPAYLAGLRAGDSLVAIAGTPVRTFEDAAEIIHAGLGKTLTVSFVRPGSARTQEVRVKPVSALAAGAQTETDYGMIGLEPRPFTQVRIYKSTPAEAFGGAWRYLVNVTATIVEGLGRTLFHLKDAGSSLTGPIGIAQMAATYARRGLDMLMQFTAFIGVTLAVMNILPLPVLDGGHIAMALYEGLMRRPLSMKAQLAFQRVGLALIGTLFVFVILADTVHLVQRQIAVHQTNRGGAPPAAAP